MTSFEKVYTAFYDKVQRDKSFFTYRNVDDETASGIIESRARGYLDEAIAYIMNKVPPTIIDFYDYNENSFNFDLSNQEVQLLAQTMYLMHFQKEFSVLRAFQAKFGVKDINQFSPANERKTFVDMYEVIKRDTNLMIKNYAMRDRETKEYIGVDYSKYSGDDDE